MVSISLDLPVAPGFVLGTAAWHLYRLCGDGRELPATVVEEVRGALGELDRGVLTVRAAPTVRGVAPGLPGRRPPSSVEAALRSMLAHAGVPTAVIVQARTRRGQATRPGTAGPSPAIRCAGRCGRRGEFRSGRSVMSLDALSRWVPAAGVQLRAALSRVESLHRSVCEVSFTVEAGRLWIDDARPVRHSRAAAERIAQAGLGEPAPRVTPAPAAGPGS